MNRSANECAIREAQFRFGAIYWGGALLSSTIFYLFKATDDVSLADHAAYLAEKLLRYGSGWLVTTLISYILLRLHDRASRRGPLESSLPMFIIVSFLVALATAPVWAGIGYAAQAAYPLPQLAAQNWNSFINDTALGAALFFGWSCLFISLIFSFELHERGLRLAAVREEALSAQMRALRYQVNPHFLFNTLNSIAGLIEEGATTRTQRMVLSLATFLRTTLSLDPMHDVSLADEIALQVEYLEIERERFADRMSLKIAVPDEVKSALVPSLILQPLIENAIKHGVGATVGLVEVTLSAYREDNQLHIVVENDMPHDGAPANSRPGMGVGLRNVDERLRVRFQDAADFHAGRISPSRYRAAIILPWRSA